jgi:hypothetical protein
LTGQKPSNKPVESHEDTPVAVPKVEGPASSSPPIENLVLEQPETTTRSSNNFEPSQKTPAVDLDSASSLLEEACQNLLKDEQILRKYREKVVPELKTQGLVVIDENSRLDIGQTEKLLKSRIDSAKQKEVLNNIAKALSTTLNVLSPVASIEPHIALVCTGLSIIMLVYPSLYSATH